MTIRLSRLPSPRRALPALALAVAIVFLGSTAAWPTAASGADAGAFTGRYDHGVPVYRLAPIAVSATRAAANLAATATPHVDAVGECAGPPT